MIIVFIIFYQYLACCTSVKSTSGRDSVRNRLQGAGWSVIIAHLFTHQNRFGRLPLRVELERIFREPHGKFGDRLCINTFIAIQDPRISSVLPHGSGATGVPGHVFQKYAIHSRLPAIAGRLEILNNLSAVTNRDQLLGVLRFRATAKRFERNHGLELCRCEWLCVRVALGCGGDGFIFFRRRHDDGGALRNFRHSALPLDGWRGASS